VGEGILAIPWSGGVGIADQVGMRVQFSVAQAMATSVALTPVTGGIVARIIYQATRR
jgi:phosphate/sulfate permease